MFLREVLEGDLAHFYEHQRDSEALAMAAFTSREREPFFTHWHTNVLRAENVTRTIVDRDLVAGYVSSWSQEGTRLVAYWVAREYWGRGLATQALSAFLELEPLRPLHAWVVLQNVASIRVLEKCGFSIVSKQQQVLHQHSVTEQLMRLGHP